MIFALIFMRIIFLFQIVKIGNSQQWQLVKSFCMNANIDTDCQIPASPFQANTDFTAKQCGANYVLESQSSNTQLSALIDIKDVNNIFLTHFQIRINFNYFQIDANWKGGLIQIILDGNFYYTPNFNSANGGTMICGNPNERDNQGFFTVDIPHSANTLDLEILDLMDVVNSGLTGIWAIQNLEIYAFTCSPFCVQCLTATTCQACQINMQLASTGICICNTDYYFDNTSNSCQKCDTSCATCVQKPDKCLTCPNSSFFWQNQCKSNCDNNQYSSGNICYPCDPSCETCIGPSPSQCATCTGGSYLESGSCVLNCSSYFYPSTASGNECLPCFNHLSNDNNPQRCFTCTGGSSSECTACANQTFLQKVQESDITGTCLNQCNNAYFQRQSNNSCQPCDPSCTSCKDNKLNCQSCAAGWYLKGNTCVQDCGDPYYQKNGLCIQCDYKCQKCVDNGGEFCNLCQNGYKKNDDGTCQSQCQSHQYSDNLGICKNCDLSCDQCTGPSNQECTKCTGTTFLEDNQCKNNCDHINHWPNPQNNNCDNCDTTCRSCNGGTSDKCLTCDGSSGNDRYLLVTGGASECVLSCPHFSMYMNKTDPNNFMCQNCDSTCLACGQYNPIFCTACFCSPALNQTNQWCEQNQNKAMVFFHKNQCLTVCPLENGVQLYGNRKTMTCNPSCEPGYYPSNQNFECTKCDPSCALCTGPNPQTDCQACAPGYFKSTTVNGCFTYCSSTEYKDTPSNSCITCNPACQQCTGPSTNQCITCNPTDYQLNTRCYQQCPKPYWGRQVDGVLTCLSNCYPGEYGDIYDPLRTCKQCNSQCQSCYGGQNSQCYSCSSTYYLLFTTCDQCPISYYGDGNSRKCVQCHQTCQSCKGQSDKDCNSCQIGRFLLNNICYAQCPKGTYSDSISQACVQQCPMPNQYQDDVDNTCSYCHPNCKTCTGSTQNNCLTCETGFYKNGSSCLSLCPPSYYPDSINFVCLKCNPECDTCYGPDKNQCQSCKLPRIFYLNQCITQCPSGFFMHPTSNSCVTVCPKSYYPDTNSAQCLLCHNFCSTCYGGGNTKCNSCKTPYLYNNNICSESCLPGSYPNGQGSCSDCDKSCLTCFGSTSLSCIKCSSGFFKSGDTQCVSECQDGLVIDQNLQKCVTCPSSTYYENKECKQCHATCLSCLGPGENQCIQCIESRGVDNSQNPIHGICECAPGYLEIYQVTCQHSSGTSAQTTAMTSQVGFYIGESIGMVDYITGLGPFYFFNLMDFCQFISYFQYINIKYPLNIKDLLEKLYLSHFTSILEQNQQVTANKRFLSSGIIEYDNPQLKFSINNRIYPLRIVFLPLILLNCCVWIFMGIISFLGYYFKTNNNKRFLVEKIKSQTNLSLGLQIFIRTFMELLLFLFLQAKMNIWDSMDIFTITVVASYVLVLIGFIAKQSFRYSKSQQVFDEKAVDANVQQNIKQYPVRCLFEGKKEDIFSKNFVLSQIIFKTIFTAIIVFLFENPEIQALGIIIVKFVFFGFYLLVRPYKQIFDNIVFLLTELFMLGVAFSVFMLIKYSSSSNAQNFGWALLVLILLAVLLNLVASILQFLVFILRKYCVSAIKKRRVVDELGVEREEEELSSDIQYVTENSNRQKTKKQIQIDISSQYQDQIQKDYIFNFNNSGLEQIVSKINNSNIINNQSVIQRQNVQNTGDFTEQDELFKKPRARNINIENDSPNAQQHNKKDQENTEQKEVRRSQQIQKPLVHNIAMVQNQLDRVIKIDKLQVYDESEIEQALNKKQSEQIDYQQINLDQKDLRNSDDSSQIKWRDNNQSGIISDRNQLVDDMQIQSKVRKFMDENEQQQNKQFSTPILQTRDYREEQLKLQMEYQDNQMLQNYRDGLGYYDFPQSYAQGINYKSQIKNPYSNRYSQPEQNVQGQSQRNFNIKKLNALPGIVKNEFITSQETPIILKNNSIQQLQTTNSYIMPQFGNKEDSQNQTQTDQNQGYIYMNQFQEQSGYQVQPEQQFQEQQNNGQSFLQNLVQKKIKNKLQIEKNKDSNANNLKNQDIIRKNSNLNFGTRDNNFEDMRDNLSIQQYNFNTNQGQNTVSQDFNLTNYQSHKNTVFIKSQDLIDEYDRQVINLDNQNYEDQEDFNLPLNQQKSDNQSIQLKISQIAKESSIKNSQIKNQKRLDNKIQKPQTLKEELNMAQGKSILNQNSSLLLEFQKLQEQKAKVRESQLSIQNANTQQNFYLNRSQTSQNQRKTKTKVKKIQQSHIVSFQRQQPDY
ncbi:hypothetical protein ABPG72_003786 [Tetrahymena utriculariae]